MARTDAMRSSIGSTSPSGWPFAHATPALVVAMAGAPRLSNRRALPASSSSRARGARGLGAVGETSRRARSCGPPGRGRTVGLGVVRALAISGGEQRLNKAAEVLARQGTTSKAFVPFTRIPALLPSKGGAALKPKRISHALTDCSLARRRCAPSSSLVAPTASSPPKRATPKVRPRPSTA